MTDWRRIERSGNHWPVALLIGGGPTDQAEGDRPKTRQKRREEGFATQLIQIIMNIQIQIASSIVALLLLSGSSRAFGVFRGAPPQAQPRISLGSHKATSKPVVATSQPVAKPALPPRPPAKPVVAVTQPIVKTGVAPAYNYPAKPARVPLASRLKKATATTSGTGSTGPAQQPTASSNNSSSSSNNNNFSDVDALLADLDRDYEETRSRYPPRAAPAPRRAFDTAAPPPPSSEDIGAELDALLRELSPAPPAPTAEEQRMVEELMGELDAQSQKIRASMPKRRLPVLGQSRQEAADRRAQLVSHKAPSEGDLQGLREIRGAHQMQALQEARTPVLAAREARRERLLEAPGTPAYRARKLEEMKVAWRNKQLLEEQERNRQQYINDMLGLY